MCRCKCCNKEFKYSDSESPMYTNEVWKSLLNYYNLLEYEIEAKIKFHKASQNKRSEFTDRDDYHCYICHECAREALGRALTISDILICPFNKSYIETYLNSVSKA